MQNPASQQHDQLSMLIKYQQKDLVEDITEPTLKSNKLFFLNLSKTSCARLL
jgi:hypothetical protein